MARAFHRDLAPDHWVTETVIETQTHALFQMMTPERALPLATVAPADRWKHLDTYLAGIRTLPTGFRHYQYWRKYPGTALVRKPRYESPQVQELVDRRFGYYGSPAHALSTIETWQALLYQPPKFHRYWSFSLSAVERELHSKQDYALHRLQEVSREYRNQVKSVWPLRVESKDAAFRYLRMLVNPQNAWDAPTPERAIGFYMADAHPSLGSHFLRFGPMFVKAFTFKNAPQTKIFDPQAPPEQAWKPSTEVNLLFELLQMPGNFLLVSEFAPQTPEKSQRHVHGLKSHAHGNQREASYTNPNADQSQLMTNGAAIAQVDSLTRAQANIDSGNYLGDFSLTFVAYGSTLEEVMETTERANRAVGSKANRIHEEENLYEQILATIPGGTNYTGNQHRFRLPVISYPDVTLFSTESTGKLRDDHLQDEYLMMLQTADGQPYYLTPRYGKLLMAILMGESSSGKSSFAVQYAAMYQKYAQKINGVWRRPKTLIYDYGKSFEAVTRYFDGSFHRITYGEEASRQNPFSFASTPDNAAFVTQWLQFVLTARDGYRLTPDEYQLLRNKVHAMFALKERNPSKARLGCMELPNDTPGRLATRLDLLKGGLFDTAEDTINQADWQTYEFRGFEKHTNDLAAYLYLNNEFWNTHLYNPELANLPKLWVMDEAHLFMTEKDFSLGQRMVQRVTMDRKNELSCLFIMPWGRVLQENPAGATLNSACPVKFFTRSPGTSEEYQQLFHLTPEVADLVENLKAPGELLFHLDTPERKEDVKLTVQFDDETLRLLPAHGNRPVSISDKTLAGRESAQALAARR